MAWPEDGQVTIRSLSLPAFIGGIDKVEALGCDAPVKWGRDGEGLHISAPGIHSAMPVAFRLQMT